MCQQIVRCKTSHPKRTADKISAYPWTKNRLVNSSRNSLSKFSLSSKIEYHSDHEERFRSKLGRIYLSLVTVKRKPQPCRDAFLHNWFCVPSDRKQKSKQKEKPPNYSMLTLQSPSEA